MLATEAIPARQTNTGNGFGSPPPQAENQTPSPPLCKAWKDSHEKTKLEQKETAFPKSVFLCKFFNNNVVALQEALDAREVDCLNVDGREYFCVQSVERSCRQEKSSVQRVMKSDTKLDSKTIKQLPSAPLFRVWTESNEKTKFWEKETGFSKKVFCGKFFNNNAAAMQAAVDAGEVGCVDVNGKEYFCFGSVGRSHMNEKSSVQHALQSEKITDADTVRHFCAPLLKARKESHEKTSFEQRGIACTKAVFCGKFFNNNPAATQAAVDAGEVGCVDVNGKEYFCFGSVGHTHMNEQFSAQRVLQSEKKLDAGTVRQFSFVSSCSASSTDFVEAQPPELDDELFEKVKPALEAMKGAMKNICKDIQKIMIKFSDDPENCAVLNLASNYTLILFGKQSTSLFLSCQMFSSLKNQFTFLRV